MNEKELQAAFVELIDPLLKVATNYANKMRIGEAPVDKESWILIKRALHAGFQIPDEDLPDDPRDLKTAMAINSPLGNDRIS